ncbi:hypothetical protein NN4_13820 [Nocardia ninae NBRC 108245]|uniref:Uncharacterized protein n=1 Tax=Nocardia ninae NBRC 108245 TaxID=1210091 RepID=A0A511M885_9NOCA|nr:hypothetical protein NN4_13820 [Nocardia ninae NBRC 108245]
MTGHLFGHVPFIANDFGCGGLIIRRGGTGVSGVLVGAIPIGITGMWAGARKRKGLAYGTDVLLISKDHH